jgi:hypothetical protein
MGSNSTAPNLKVAPARGSPQYSFFDEFDGVDETYHDECSS